MKEVNQFLNSLNIKQDDYIVAGISGGPDSMCLLSLLLKLRQEKNFNIVCAHVNHKIRVESDDEEKYVKEFCKVNNIIFEVKHIDKYVSTQSHEEEARNYRYQFFDDLMNKYQAQYLFTGHHGDDLIETVLMRLARGSSLKGYAGIERISYHNNYKIIRPLLTVTKEQIIKYAIENELEYAIDNSNSSDDFTRNRYRKYVLPVLKNENSNVHLKFLAFSEKLIESNDFILKEAMQVKNKIYFNNQFDIKKFTILHPIIKKTVLQLICYDIYSEDITKINDSHIKNILSLIEKPKNGEIYLPNQLIIKKEYDYLKFDYQHNSQKYHETLTDKIILPNNYCIKRIENSTDHSNNTIYLNSKDITLPLIVRTKLQGDYIDVKNMQNKKKVKEIFIDAKIPINERNSWPIVTDSDNNILWIPGIKKSKYDCNKLSNCDIILTYCIERKQNESK